MRCIIATPPSRVFIPQRSEDQSEARICPSNAVHCEPSRSRSIIPHMTNTAVARPPPKREIRADKMTPKLRQVIDAMVWEGVDFQQAGQIANMNAFAIRRALTRPHVLAYMREQKQMLLASDSPRNIHRLREIREAAPNMPAVQAIRDLEAMQGTQAMASASAGIAQSSPGITIVVMPATAHADGPQAVMKPAIEGEFSTIPAQSPHAEGGREK